MIIFDKYTVQDRVTTTKAAFQIIDEQLAIVTSVDTILPEPVFRDTVNTNNYWKLFISDGQIGWEDSSDHYGAIVVLIDSVTADQWKLQISDGQLNWTHTVYFNQFSIYQSIITKEMEFDSQISKEIILQSEMVAA